MHYKIIATANQKSLQTDTESLQQPVPHWRPQGNQGGIIGRPRGDHGTMGGPRDYVGVQGTMGPWGGPRRHQRANQSGAHLGGVARTIPGKK